MHVREWLPDELHNLLKSSGFNVVYMSQQVSNLKGNVQYNAPPTVNMGNQMFVIQRDSKKENKNAKQVEIFAIVIINIKTNRETIADNCKYIKNQADTVIILALESAIDSMETCSSQIVRYKNPEDLPKRAKALIEQLPKGSWFIIQDAHERISILQFIEPDITSLREYIEYVDQSSYSFNAIPCTIFFANDRHGTYFSRDIQYKIYSETRWGSWEMNLDIPEERNASRTGWEFEVAGSILTNNILNRVKIFKKENGEVFIVQHKTDLGSIIIADILFEGRKVYPYHLLTIRHHPQIFVNKTSTYNILYNNYLQYSFGTTIKNGYLNSYFNKFVQRTIIY